METVRVVGFGKLKNLLKTEARVSAGQTALRAIESLQLGTLGNLPFTALVNGRVVAWDYLLQPGDELVLVPTIGGGC